MWSSTISTSATVLMISRCPGDQTSNDCNQVSVRAASESLPTQQQMKTLSRHSDTAKAFAYLLKQWDALNVYCSNGWVEIDNNIAENALRGVAVGRKNWMFAGSDSGGEHAAVLYSLIGTCRLNNVEPEKWLRYVIEHIQDWPANRVRDLLPWKVDLSSQ